LLTDQFLIEWLDSETEVVQISPLLARRRTASTPKFAFDRDEINQSATGLELDQSDIFLVALQGATQGITVEVHHFREIDHAKYQMVDIE